MECISQSLDAVRASGVLDDETIWQTRRPVDSTGKLPGRGASGPPRREKRQSDRRAVETNGSPSRPENAAKNGQVAASYGEWSIHRRRFLLQSGNQSRDTDPCWGDFNFALAGWSCSENEG